MSTERKCWAVPFFETTRSLHLVWAESKEEALKAAHFELQHCDDLFIEESGIAPSEPEISLDTTA